MIWEIRERVGKALAYLAGYDIDGLVDDAEYYAEHCRDQKIMIDRLNNGLEKEIEWRRELTDMLIKAEDQAITWEVRFWILFVVAFITAMALVATV